MRCAMFRISLLVGPVVVLGNVLRICLFRTLGTLGDTLVMCGMLTALGLCGLTIVAMPFARDRLSHLLAIAACLEIILVGFLLGMIGSHPLTDVR
jgi:hypothetical protein